MSKEDSSCEEAYILVKKKDSKQIIIHYDNGKDENR